MSSVRAHEGLRLVQVRTAPREALWEYLRYPGSRNLRDEPHRRNPVEVDVEEEHHLHVLTSIRLCRSDKRSPAPEKLRSIATEDAWLPSTCCATTLKAGKGRFPFVVQYAHASLGGSRYAWRDNLCLLEKNDSFVSSKACIKPRLPQERSTHPRSRCTTVGKCLRTGASPVVRSYRRLYLVDNDLCLGVIVRQVCWRNTSSSATRVLNRI